MSLQTASMILRILVNSPLTTKGAELTWEELDGNLIKIYQDLAAKIKAGAIPDFDSGKTYNLGDAANYNDVTWLYVNGTPSAGIDPGSNPAYWGEIDPTFFIHEVNKDQMLDKGGANQVTAAELKDLVDAGVPTTIYTGSGYLSGDTSINGGTEYSLALVDLAILLMASAGQIIMDGTNNGDVSTNAGVYINAYAVNPEDVAFTLDNGSGQVLQMFGDGRFSITRPLLIGTTNTPIDPKLLFDLANSGNRLSRPFPPLTPAEIDGLSGIPECSMCLNTATKFPQIYNELYGWQPLGYGVISYIIDFSVTPFSGSPISFETRIPAGKIIHKIVAIGTAIDVSVADAIDIGLTSDTTYFSPDILLLNAESGQSSSGNSKRTVYANEDLIINPNGAVSSGVLEFTVYHT